MNVISFISIACVDSADIIGNMDDRVADLVGNMDDRVVDLVENMDDRVVDLNDRVSDIVGNMDDVTEPKKCRLPYFYCLC